MDRTARFRRVLANRFLQVAGLMLAGSSVGVAGCGSSVTVDTYPSSGSSGAGGATTGTTGPTGPTSGSGTTSGTTSATTGGGGASSSSASSAVATVSSGISCGGTDQCIPWNGTPDTCPPTTQALTYFQMAGCPNSCFTSSVDSGPWWDSASGSCCYGTTQYACLGTGRPFLVDREARVAATRPGRGWTDGAARPAIDGLDPALRAELCAAWTRDALLEHASVASFARFSMELLGVGAPADLVEAAHRAALDEIEHARRCFELAAAYAGTPVEPAAFPFEGKVDVASNLAAIAARSVLEGCVGETLAAIQAAEQLERAVDPTVCTVLATIAADEARHAELAWRTVAWALSIGGDDVRRAVEVAFADAARAVPSDEGPMRPELAAHGRLDAPTLHEVLARGLEDVVLPCARALLAPRDGAPRPFTSAGIRDHLGDAS